MVERIVRTRSRLKFDSSVSCSHDEAKIVSFQTNAFSSPFLDMNHRINKTASFVFQPNRNELDVDFIIDFYFFLNHSSYVGHY